MAGKVENLTPFQKGQSGNRKGRPKGIPNWSTVVKNLLADKNLADKMIAKKPDWWETLPKGKRNGAHAIVVAMMINALNGDDKAATWLRRTGFGDKLDIVSDDKPLKPVAVYSMKLTPEEIQKLNERQSEED